MTDWETAIRIITYDHLFWLPGGYKLAIVLPSDESGRSISVCTMNMPLFYENSASTRSLIQSLFFTGNLIFGFCSRISGLRIMRLIPGHSNLHRRFQDATRLSYELYDRCNILKHRSWFGIVFIFSQNFDENQDS